MSSRIPRALGLVAVGVLAVALVAIAENFAIELFFQPLTRVATDFSAAYLRHDLDTLAASPPTVVFLGDSVLWGYGLQAGQNAPSILIAQGCRCHNLAFKTGSPVNDYALVLLFKAWGIRPKLVVVEINQRVFNPVDAVDQRLHPAIAQLVDPLLTRDDRSTLSFPAAPPPLEPAQRLDRVAASLSTVYAMRPDLRNLLFGDAGDAPPAKPLTQADFEGTYDLEALDDDNFAVHFLEKTVRLLHAERIPVVAFMTPTNHALVGKYVDTPEYRANNMYLRHLLEVNGARVLDLDAALPAADFLDNDHLTADGQRQLASILEGVLPR